MLPLGYLWHSRIRGMRAAVGYICHDFIPVALTLWMLHRKDIFYICLAYAGFISLYEIGYLINDLAPSSTESGGERFSAGAPSFLWFVAFRLLFAIACAWCLARHINWLVACEYLLVSLIVLLLLLLHTHLGLCRPKWLRIASFCALATYRYATWTLPFTDMPVLSLILIGSFLIYGLPRVVEYSARKLQNADTRDAGRTEQGVQLFMLGLTFPLVALLQSNVLWILWTSHCGVALFFFLGSLAKRKLLPESKM
jgi:hypothetical protein